MVFNYCSWRLRAAMAIVAVTTLAGCSREPERPPTIRSGFAIVSSCPADPPYIRSDYLGAPVGANTEVGERITEYLRASEQGPLWCGDTTDAYRAIWLPANRRARLASVARDSNGWTARGVQFSDPRSTDADRSNPIVEHRAQESVSDQHVDTITAALSASNLWNAPAWRYSLETFDGDTLILEMRTQGSYRILTRIKVPDSDVQSIIEKILQAAGIPSSPRDE